MYKIWKYYQIKNIVYCEFYINNKIFIISLRTFTTDEMLRTWMRKLKMNHFVSVWIIWITCCCLSTVITLSFNGLLMSKLRSPMWRHEDTWRWADYDGALLKSTINRARVLDGRNQVLPPGGKRGNIGVVSMPGKGYATTKAVYTPRVNFYTTEEFFLESHNRTGKWIWYE